MVHQLERCNFAKTEKKAKLLPLVHLDYVIKDCREAAEAAETFDRLGLPNNSGKYWDEYHVFSQERNRRGKVK